MNIDQAIVLGHAIQTDLFDPLLDVGGYSKNRRQSIHQLKQEQTIYADAEERHCYLSLIKIHVRINETNHA